MNKLGSQHLRYEEVFGEVSAEPAETVQSIELLFLDKVRHTSETAHAEHVKRQMVLACTRTKVHLPESIHVITIN